MSKKIITTEGVIHGHGKGFELPSGKYLVVIIVAAIIFAVIGYFATYAPVKTGPDPPQEVKTAEVQPVENPAVNAVVAEMGSYVPINRFNRQDIQLSNIPEKISFTGFYIRDLKAKGDYLFGYVGSDTRSTEVYINFAWLDKDGYELAGTGMEIAHPNPRTGYTEFGTPRDSMDQLSFKDGKEIYFRMKNPGLSAKFLSIETH